MPYYIIRVLLLVIIFIVLVTVFKKNTAKKIKFAIAVSFAVVTSISLYPIENLFLCFDTPEAAFNYYKSENISGVLYGNASCVVIYSDSWDIIPKCDGGYKIPRAFYTKIVANTVSEHCGFFICNASGTDDYYLIGNSSYEVEGNISIFVGGKKVESTYCLIGKSIYVSFSGYGDYAYLLINGVEVPI